MARIVADAACGQIRPMKNSLSLVWLALVAGSAVASAAPSPTPVRAVAPIRASTAPVVGLPAADQDSIDVEFAKLEKQARDEKEKLQDQIKAIEKQLEVLKSQIKKIDLITDKIAELLPVIVEQVGSKTGDGSASLAALLGQELAKAGVSVSPQKVQELAAAMTKGGQGSMAVALHVVMAIAEASADLALGGRSSLHAAPFPNLRADGASAARLKAFLAGLDCFSSLGSAVDLATALPSPQAAAFWGQRATKAAQDCMQAAASKIDGKKVEIKELRDAIKKIEKQIEELEKAHQKATPDLAKKKLEEQMRMQKSPTPKPNTRLP
jgi:septal ring factor EnvC (AmiA/AmiB activator)